ncbi:MAG: chromosome segregation protein SMC [Gemmatales bacterium]|nr:chromosome segregation protein SMC [Gemmatales bacterium]
MLKRLELIGFKSFADKTVLEFGPGLTAIVGPNGSGKSNIVDAVRWILGEQSAKSLRGGEMTDVIFHGSPTRRSLGMAEVTLTLDNSRRLLPLDCDEVAITRRVYRDGHGEYLINHQPARLRDIKELFLGSGLGGNSYCIIEQGKVDLFLAASPQERRAFFEEAAGISRFKAKKIEALRKLERVQENLTRLQDIQAEVERQLRSVRQQASKAQRYRELSEQLRNKRVDLSLIDCHAFYSQWQEAQTEGSRLRQRLSQLAEQITQTESALQGLEVELSQRQQTLHQAEEQVAAARQQVATARTTLQHELRAAESLLTEQLRLAHHSAQGDRLLVETERAWQEHLTVCQALRQDATQCRAQAQHWENQVRQVQRELAAQSQQLQQDKTQLMELMREAARWANELVSLQTQHRTLAFHRDKILERQNQATQSLEQLAQESRDLELAERELQTVLQSAQETCQEVRQRRDQTRQHLDQLLQDWTRQKEHRSALAAQAEVLEAWERSWEGVGAGVRQVLQWAAQSSTGQSQVLGLIADLITVSPEYASLIDLALGPRAEAILVHDTQVWHAFVQEIREPLAGPVTFVPFLDAEQVRQRREALLRQVPVNIPCSADGLPDDPDLLACAANLARAGRPEFASLPEQLLHDTLVVRDITAACRLRAWLPGFRFVTMQGQLLEADGSLVLRGDTPTTGLLSRKSALRELRVQLAQCDAQLTQLQPQIEELRQQLHGLEQLDEEAQRELRVLNEQWADLRSRLHQQRQREQALREEWQLGQTELAQMEQELSQLQDDIAQAQQQQHQAELRLQDWHRHLDQLETSVAQLQRQLHEYEQGWRQAQVTLTSAEERLRAAETQLEQARRVLEERRLAARNVAQRYQELQSRIAAAELAALRAGQDWAEAARRQQVYEQEVLALRQRLHAFHQHRHHLQAQLQAYREQHQEQQQRVHQHELHQRELEHRLQELAHRLRDEYDLDLLELYRKWSPPDPLPDRATLEMEIAELKRKIARLGNVNLEALDELAQLEERARTLQTQLHDLREARRSLDEILQRINEESRRAFLATFESVRMHFQELFRKLFGGGQADVVLENPDDPLESGIEIVARPPGKELRSISLLSGGEKTLAAVALLLAIFRSKPSPFCILDEVDAALDEMNIGRFTAVLREFTDQSQFILITHSKKTMTAVDALYGITMQESGVSKPVAVRFEDWPTQDWPTDAASGGSSPLRREATTSNTDAQVPTATIAASQEPATHPATDAA